MATLRDRVKRSWNAFFFGRDPTAIPREYVPNPYEMYYETFYTRPDRYEGGTNTIRNVISAAYCRMAVDCSLVRLKHVRVNEDGNYESDINDSLNNCISLMPNKDQTARNLIRDCVSSMFDEGVVAIVPYEVDIDPSDTDSYRILSIRIGKIVAWRPDHIQVELYNDIIGKKQKIWMAKRMCAIVENPFYQIVNEPNSVAQRLVRTLNQLDKINAQMSSGKWDLIIQLPYALRSELQKEQARERANRIDEELENSRHGIAFIDAAENVIQLNRPIANHLWEEAKDLKAQLFNELGFSEKILDGTADEATMLNYQNQIIEPILNEIVESMEVKWISKTARSQGQAIRYFREPFKLLPASQLADVADTMIRNEILASNDFRSILGYKPSSNPTAQEPHNPNMPERTETVERTGIKNLVKEIQNGKV